MRDGSRGVEAFDEDYRENLARYARLIVARGLNVQPGQLVNISSELYHRELLGLLVEEAYRRGAGFVHVEFSDPILQRLRFQHSQPEFLDRVPGFFSAKFGELVDERAANLKILGPEYPDFMEGLDPHSVNLARKAGYQSAKRFYNEGIEKSKVQWCVVAAATARWAERLFPGLKGVDAERKLWREIFQICRVDRPDYLELWENHNSVLKKRAARLSEIGISQLRFSGPGTDLRVGLHARAIFKGGADRSDKGLAFLPNIPTEECFTTPDWRTVSGRVAATRPFLVNGVLVKDLSLTFEAGDLRSYSCSEGGASLEAYIASDPGARRLGEVALVGVDSPIFSSKIVFEEILFDENAACHIALGSAYRGCLQGGTELSEDECAEIGCNSSSVHTDIMISSEQVNVFAELRGGGSLCLLQQGVWSPDFS